MERAGQGRGSPLLWSRPGLSPGHPPSLLHFAPVFRYGPSPSFPKLRQPEAISGHHSYYLWGPRGATGQVVIALGVPRDTLETIFARIEEVARIHHPHALPSETNLPVYLCGRPRLSLSAAWPLLRRFVRIN